MKSTILLPAATLAMLMASACNKSAPDVAKQIAELESKTNAAITRQQELEQQIADQKLAAERDMIERERQQIDTARADLERQQGEAAAAEADKIAQREQALATREGKLDQLQSTIDDKNNALNQRDQNLSKRDRDLAGREALDFKDEGEPAPAVGDYGMFYDSLSAYGSWFETPDYGYVWQPVIVRDATWRPYARGRWVCSDRGWTWISDEPYGWATYHYGRWARLRNHGWVWVPGSEWAPSWVSWRSNNTHIGWAPLPPETLAFRGHHWDSSVDVEFGIGAMWFNFVETRNFGRSINQYCLPYSQNNIFIQQTTNITNIHIQNRQVICGGPRYQDVSNRIGHPMPFYRLDMDRHDRPGRDGIGMQPQIHGDRLRIAAPNIDVAWNDGLKPSRVKGRMDSLTVERPSALSPEITNRFRQSREEGHNKAEQSITELGGRDQFHQRRLEQLDANRRQANPTDRGPSTTRDSSKPLAPTTGTHELKRQPDHAEQTQRQPEQNGPRPDGKQIIQPQDGTRQRVDDATQQRQKLLDQAEHARQQQLQQPSQATQRQLEQNGPRSNGKQLAPQNDNTPQSVEDAARQRKQLADQATAEQFRQRQAAQLQQQQQAAQSKRDQAAQLKQQQEAAQVQRQQQQAAQRLAEQDHQQQLQQPLQTTKRLPEQSGLRSNGTQLTPQNDNIQQRVEDAARQRKQMADQATAEQFRQRQAAQLQQQQQAAQSQREQASQLKQQQEAAQAQSQQQQAAQSQREQASRIKQQLEAAQAQRQQQQAAQRQAEQASRQQQMQEAAQAQRQQQQAAQRQAEQASRQQQQAPQREQLRQQPPAPSPAPTDRNRQPTSDDDLRLKRNH